MGQWQEILIKCGLPTTVICQDYETFFDTDYSLSKLSTIEYITDERFAFTGLGLLSTDDGVSRFIEPDQIEDAIRSVDYDNVTVLQQNCRFDSTITQVKFGIVPPHIIDLKDLASHYDSRMSHKLADLAKMFGLKPKGETQNFKGLLWDNMTLEQRQALAEYTINDVELETELFKILLPKLSNPKTELALARHTLDLWLFKQFKVDRDLARKLQVQMRTKVAAAIQASGHTPKELRSRNLFPKLLQEALPDGETVPMKLGKPDKDGNPRYIPALAKTDKACQQLMIHPKKEVCDLMKAKMGASEWNAHIKKLGCIITQSIANGGLLRVPLNYHGCHCMSPDSEVLTPYGWCSFANWDAQIPIMQWNTNGSMSWCIAEKYESNEVPELCYMDAPRAKGAFTSGHVLPYSTRRGKQYNIKVGDAINKRLNKFPLSGCFIGTGEITPYQMRVLVMTQADGHWKLSKTRGNYLVFGFGKPRKIRRCIASLEHANIPFTQRVELSGTTRIICRVIDLPGWLTPTRKIFGPWLLNSTRVAREAFFDELVHWDGWRENNSAGFAYCSKERINAEWIQILGHLTNRAVSVIKRDRSKEGWSDSYRCFISDCITAQIDPKHWKVMAYRGKVYCATTETGYFLYRYKGRPAISHNTGRWSGGEGYNLLNMTKRDRAGIETDPLKKETRKTLSAPDGYILGVCDSAQIEARIAFWLAGQQDMLNKFTNGEDLYSEYASKLFKEPCRKPQSDDPPDVYARFDLMRNVIGKTNVLGDQYGLGAKRFYHNCLSNPKLRPLFDSGEWNFKFCQDAIDLYRGTCSKVVKYWKRVEDAFRRVVRFPHLEAKVGPVTFRNDHRTIEIVLPSGRILYYRHAKIDRTGSIKWHHGALWGGSLLENIDQAISRCLLGCWILDLEKAGIPVISHVYDSIETLLPEDQAEELLAKQAAIMCTVPSWADGLPLAVDSKLSKTL